MSTDAAKADGLRYALLLATASLGIILVPLNSTMLAVALPDIRAEFSVGHNQVAWLFSAYLIAMAVAQPLGGRIGDQIGQTRALQIGFLAFLAISLTAAAAPNLPLLIAARTGQAVMGALIAPNVLAIIRANVPSQMLGRATGAMTTMIGFSAAAGPLLGAVLLEVGSWRLLFLVNAPIVLGAWLGLSALRNLASMPRSPVEVDLLGAGYLTGLLVTLTLLFDAGGNGTALTIVLTGLAFLTLTGLFIHRQFRSPRPVAEWALLRSRSYTAATTYVLMGNMVMYTALLTVPFLIVEIQGKSAGLAGALIGVMAVQLAILAAPAGWLADMRGRRLPALLGAAALVLAAGMLLVSADADTSVVVLAVSPGILGFGIGIGSGPAMTAALEAAPREQAGVAAGTVSMMRYFGSIIGAGLLGSVLATDKAVPDVDLFRVIFAVLLVAACLTLVSANFIYKLPQPTSAR